ncbi:hypothetical protein [Microbacterium luticocti]|uniref:hypothetical protein n=1 Tax=Microbacterium luticocti TaxID=451764 RepID=UPI000415907D|nr:hypothetical protein [Microbacterium luticocti]
MEWTADVATGDWLRERLDAPWAYTMHDVVPRGFEAYARVFHPAARERPEGRPWPALPFDAHRREWDAFHRANPKTITEPVTWAQTAAAMGTTMHPLAQWTHLVAPGVIVENEDFSPDSDGWRYLDPELGALDPQPLATLAALLAEATTTPDAGCIAIWEGWGDLVGGMHVDQPHGFFFPEPGMPRRYVGGAPDSPGQARTEAILYRSLKDVFNNPFRKATWRPGILSDEISRGPRLELPNRSYVLFRGGISAFTDPAWVLDVPWRDLPAEEHGFPPSSRPPNLVWPDDHAWVMVSEIDWDSTIVAGSTELIDAIVADPALEAASVPADADLSWDADEENR